MLTEKREQNTVFLDVKFHNICTVSKEFREGWEEKNPLNPKTGQPVRKWIKPFRSVSGYATKLEWYDRTDEKSSTRFVGYKLHLEDGEERYVLDLSFPGAAYDAFTNFAENIDWALPVEFAAWHNKRDDKTAFCAKQGAESIKYKYTVSNPGNRPPAIQKQGIGGKVTWDFADQQIWLKQRIDSVVIPAIDAAEKARAIEPQPRVMSASAAAFAAQAPTVPSAEYDGDMPADLPDKDSIPF